MAGNSARFFFILSGEHSTLPLAELKAILQAYAIEYKIVGNFYKLVEVEADRTRLESIAGRGDDGQGNYTPRDFADWREIPSEALENSRLREALKRALASLPEKYRQVLVLRDIEHLNIAETAKLMGISEAAVKTRLLRARLMMRDVLAPGFDGAWKKGREYEKVRPW